jgi:hypothetical protein
MLVFVEQRHIDKAGSRSCNCPIALALYEQLGIERSYDLASDEPRITVARKVRISYRGKVGIDEYRDTTYELSESAKKFIELWDSWYGVTGIHGEARRRSAHPCVIELYQIPRNYDYERDS